MNYWHIQMHPANQKEFDRERVSQILIETHYIGVGEWDDGASKIRRFREDVSIGDVMLVRSKGPLALVEVIGHLEYEENPNEELDWFQNRRQVKILGWDTPEIREQLGDTVDGIYNPNSFDRIKTKSYYIENWHKMIMREARLNEVALLLKAKGQVVLQGPPGTGKTWLAERVAEKIAAEAAVKLVQFHPAYAYEDFVRGIVAKTGDQGGLIYQAEDKTLAVFAKLAAAAPREQYFVLIIDEINRANLPSVLGEMIYALEYRGKPVETLYADAETGDRRLVLPENLLIIGTMNTADRSVGHLDYAIRRRFAFVTVLPEEEHIGEDGGRKLFREVSALFEKEFLAPEFERDQVQPGHSYFMTVADKGLTLRQKLDYEIKPLLREYLRDGVLRPNAKEGVKNLRA
ncbi:MAG: AAA family ATPase [Janthinobacterium lividum]